MAIHMALNYKLSRTQYIAEQSERAWAFATFAFASILLSRVSVGEAGREYTRVVDPCGSRCGRGAVAVTERDDW